MDDDLLEAARGFTEEQGYHLIENDRMRLVMHGEYESIARHFDFFGERVNFYPGSFAGFRANELRKVPLNLGDADAMPVSVFTTSPAPLAACFVRLISRAPQNSMSDHLNHDLCFVLSYLLFDMSYEGDYMVIEEVSQEDIDRQVSRGLDLFQKWQGWRDDEMWIADALEAIIQGKGKYEYLPTSHVMMPNKDEIHDGEIHTLVLEPKIPELISDGRPRLPVGKVSTSTFSRFASTSCSPSRPSTSMGTK